MHFQRFVPSFAILAIAATAQTTTPAPEVKTVEEIAAKVNGEIVTRGELEEKHKEAEAFATQNGMKGQRLQDFLKQQDTDALRNEIDTLLLVQKGKDLPGLNVDSDVAKYFNNLQAQYKFNDVDKFHDWLAQQMGKPYEELKEQKKREIIAQRVVGYEVVSHVNVSETELQKYYEDHKKDFMRDEQVFLSQILLSTEGKTPDQVKAAEARAKELVDRARKGEKFSDLARDNSDDLETAQNGGYIGSVKRGTMKPEIEAIVFQAKKGFVTDPIKLTSPAGFLILKVDEHYEAGQASFEEVRDEVQNALVGPRVEPKVRDYLTQLRQGAFLQVKDGYVDTGAAPGKDTRWQDVATLKAPTTSKEEVLSSAKVNKKVLGVPIPGTRGEVKTLAQTEKPPKPPKHKARPDLAPDAVESAQVAKAAKQDSRPPMPPIKQ